MATNDTASAPRAVIHKRILDAAETRPNASLEALAADLAGASPALVERVLDEYGDPGAEPPAVSTPPGSPATGPPEGETMSETTSRPTAVELTDKQRETLQAIAERPDATQAELADHLGVSRATVNKRVNGIAGFEWQDRRAFVADVLGDRGLEGEPEAESAPASAAASDGGQLLEADDEHAVQQLQERVARVEQQLGERADGPIDDAELLAKVLRAVLADGAISEDEELRVIESLL